MILSPVEGQLIATNGEYIDVEVTLGNPESVGRIVLLNSGGQPESDCTPQFLKKPFGCTLIRPKEEGPYPEGAYRIRAYREAPNSYDEVTVRISGQRVNLEVEGVAH
jgi:hypothetical protein